MPRRPVAAWVLPRSLLPCPWVRVPWDTPWADRAATERLRPVAGTGRAAGRAKEEAQGAGSEKSLGSFPPFCISAPMGRLTPMWMEVEVCPRAPEAPERHANLAPRFPGAPQSMQSHGWRESLADRKAGECPWARTDAKEGCEVQVFGHPRVGLFLGLWVSLQRPQTRHACTEPRLIGTCGLGSVHFLGLVPVGFLYTGPSP